MLVQYPAQAPGRALDTGAWSRCPPHCSPGGSGAACPCSRQGLTCSPAPLGRMEAALVLRESCLRVGDGDLGEEEEGPLQAVQYDNCLVREDRRATAWSLCNLLTYLGLPTTLHAPSLLLQLAAVSPTLSYSSFSIYRGPHQTGSPSVFSICLCLSLFKLCKGN